MELIQTFDKPISGWWDGGPKKEFSWRVDPVGQTKTHVRVGSWGANHWFTVKRGRSEKEALSIARGHLGRAAIAKGLNCKFRIVED